MSDENQVVTDVTAAQGGENPNAAEVANQVEATPEELKAKLKALEEEKASNAELLKKLRKFEKENKAKADEEAKAKGEYQKLYEEQLAKFSELEGKVRDKAINGAIETALKDAKAKSVSTVMKLIDKSLIKVEGDEVDAKSLAKVIEGLKVSDPILFDEAQVAATTVKRAAEGNPVSGFEKEMRACKSQQEIYAVMKKYGKV